MAENQGNQTIGFKYQTPLQASELNNLLIGLNTQGLITEPTFVVTSSIVNISSFSCMVKPTNYATSEKEYEKNKLVAITVKDGIGITIDSSMTVAIGFEYSFTNDNGGLQADWYGKFTVLNYDDDIESYKGIIIATVHRSNNEIKVTTNGADWSDALIKAKGLDTNMWLSLISPRRVCTSSSSPSSYDIYTKLEVRSHNDKFSSNNYFENVTDNGANAFIGSITDLNVSEVNSAKIYYIGMNQGVLKVFYSSASNTTVPFDALSSDVKWIVTVSTNNEAFLMNVKAVIQHGCRVTYDATTETLCIG